MKLLIRILFLSILVFLSDKGFSQDSLKKITLKPIHLLQKDLTVDSIEMEKSRINDSINNSAECQNSRKKYYALLKNARKELSEVSEKVKTLNKESNHKGSSDVYYVVSKCELYSLDFKFKGCRTATIRMGCIDYTFKIEKKKRAKTNLKDGTIETIYYYEDLQSLPVRY